MKPVYYVRDGRRFVRTEPPKSVDNTGKYYQKNGIFVSKRTEDSIGLCIISYATEHVVMSLKDDNVSCHLDFAKLTANNLMEYGTLPTFQEFLTAFEKYNSILNLRRYKYYWIMFKSNIVIASAYHDGHATIDPTWYRRYGPALIRPIVRIKQ